MGPVPTHFRMDYALLFATETASRALAYWENVVQRRATECIGPSVSVEDTKSSRMEAICRTRRWAGNSPLLSLHVVVGRPSCLSVCLS